MKEKSLSYRTRLFFFQSFTLCIFVFSHVFTRHSAKYLRGAIFFTAALILDNIAGRNGIRFHIFLEKKARVFQ